MPHLLENDIWHWFPCGADVRADGHTVMWLPNFADISLTLWLYHPLPIKSFTIKVPPSNKHRTEMKELCTQSSNYSTPFTSSSSFCSISSCKSLSRSASSSYFQNVKEYSMIKRYIDKNMTYFIAISTLWVSPSVVNQAVVVQKFM